MTTPAFLGSSLTTQPHTTQSLFDHTLISITLLALAIVFLATTLAARSRTRRLRTSIASLQLELASAVQREQEAMNNSTTANRSLEERSAELTVRSRRMASALNAARAASLLWVQDTGSIEWEIGAQKLGHSAGLSKHWTFNHWTDLIGDEGLASLIEVCAKSRETNAAEHIKLTIVGAPQWSVRVTLSPEPEVKGAPNLVAGMMGLVPTIEQNLTLTAHHPEVRPLHHPASGQSLAASG